MAATETGPGRFWMYHEIRGEGKPKVTGQLSERNPMRKLFWQINVTLDGLMEGPHHELDTTAQFPSEEFDRYAHEMLQSIDGMILGRKTYELFADYWPTATGPDAGRLNQLPKVVFSRTLKTVRWNNSRLVSGSVVEEVQKLKEGGGRELAVFGSAELGSTLVRLGLIDEIRVLISPVILGQGAPMFKEIEQRVDLKLITALTWSSGIVVLYYQPLPISSTVETISHENANTTARA